MSPSSQAAWLALIDHLHRQVAADPELAGLLHNIGKALADEFSPSATPLVEIPAAETPASTPTPTSEPDPILVELPSLPIRTGPLPELTLGKTVPTATPSWQALIPDDSDGPSLETLAAHCRLKAEGVRWACERQKLIARNADHRTEVAPRDRDILDRARESDCLLWMNTPDWTPPVDLAKAERLAETYEAVAEAGLLLDRVLDSPTASKDDLMRGALEMLAEAQSALRVQVEAQGGPKDLDQFRVYERLRQVASDRQVYLRRYMKLADPASPDMIPALRVRLTEFEARILDQKGRSKAVTKGLGRLRYHAGLLAQGRSVDTEHDWGKVVATLVDLVEKAGVPASNVEIRDILMPIVDELPESTKPALPGSVSQVFDSIDEGIARSLVPPEPLRTPERIADVREIADHLRGRAVVLIGGDCRPYARQAIVDAFELSRLDWISSREHESIAFFEAPIARSDVSLVILAIRWSSHSFGDIKQFCDAHGKPLVRLKAGYNPNQLARQILDQCSGLLPSPPADREAAS